mgnify:CR=1 FL=1
MRIEIRVGTGRSESSSRVARALDGGAAERVHYSTLYGGSDLRVSFAKSSHVVELHFFVHLFGGRIKSSSTTFPNFPPNLLVQTCANTAREVASGWATSDLRRAAHGG